MAQNSHRKIAVTTVAASGLATIPLQKSQSLFVSPVSGPLPGNQLAPPCLAFLLFSNTWEIEERGKIFRSPLNIDGLES